MTRILSETLLFITGSTELMLLFKTTLILALGLSLVWAARSARASVRHLLLSCTFAGVIALPFVAKVTPALELEINGPATAIATDQRLKTDELRPDRSTPVAASASTSSSTNGLWFPQSTQSVVWLIWGAGASAFLVSLAISLSKLRRIRRAGIPSLDAREQLNSLAAEAGIKRNVEVLLQNEVRVPFTFGHFRPVILLPTDASTWSEINLHRVFVHELEHIKRSDWLVQVFTRAVCAVYWFQPLAWIAWRQICLEAERASDDAVLARTERTDYAEQLVTLARRLSNRLAPPVLSMANRSDLSRRVNSILDINQARGRTGVRWTLMALGFSAAIVVAISPGLAISRTQTQSAKVNLQKAKSRAIDRALVEAAESGETKEIEDLLNAGAHINAAVDGDGTALIVAAREGNKTLVEFLLGRGADVNVPSPGDGNALIMAAREGHIDIVKLLLDHGANIDQVVAGDENPLIQASGEGELEVVKLLIARGANVNARALSDQPNGEWRTPLGMAKKGGHKEIVALLIAAGARE
jgi:bla regulator protein blaR1